MVEEQQTSQITSKELVQTQAEREMLKKENDAMEQELLRAEKLRSQSRMAGKSQIAPQTPQINPEEEKKKRLKEAWKGSSIEKAIERHG